VDVPRTVPYIVSEILGVRHPPHVVQLIHFLVFRVNASFFSFRVMAR